MTGTHNDIQRKTHIERDRRMGAMQTQAWVSEWVSEPEREGYWEGGTMRVRMGFEGREWESRLGEWFSRREEDNNIYLENKTIGQIYRQKEQVRTQTETVNKEQMTTYCKRNWYLWVNLEAAVSLPGSDVKEKRVWGNDEIQRVSRPSDPFY